MLVKTKTHTPSSEFQSALTKSSKWQDAEWVCARLRKAGYQAVVAGGAVRDAWLGCSPSEFDIATSATPEQIEAQFSKTIAVGKCFGVIVVILDSGPIEVATFRADGTYTDGRHPDQVVFADLERDAERRDFTINAMFYDPDSRQIIDVVGGINDLENKLIRAVGVPEKRFQEDALRVMRAVRFTAQLGFTLEAETEREVQSAAHSLIRVSRERLTAEFDKLLIGRFAEAGLCCFQRLGLDRVVFPRWANILFPLTISLSEFSLEERRLAFFWPVLESAEVADGTLESTLKEYRYGREFIQLVQWLRNQMSCFEDGVIDNSEKLHSIAEIDARWAKQELKSTTLERRLVAQILFFVDQRAPRVLQVLGRRRAAQGDLPRKADAVLSRRGLVLGHAPKMPSANEVRSGRGSLEGAALGAAIQELYRERLLRVDWSVPGAVAGS